MSLLSAAWNSGASCLVPIDLLLDMLPACLQLCLELKPMKPRGQVLIEFAVGA